MFYDLFIIVNILMPQFFVLKILILVNTLQNDVLYGKTLHYCKYHLINVQLGISF